MTLKTRLIDILNTMREQQLAFPEYLTEGERKQAGKPDDWSAKDEIIHITVWANYHLDNLELILEGGTPPGPIFAEIEDEKNRSIFDEHKDTSWNQAFARVNDTYDRIDDFVRHHSDELLLEIPPGEERPVWRIIAGSHIIHPMSHLWDYLQRHGYGEQVIALFGEDFTARLADLVDDEAWQGTVYYNLACIYAREGRKGEAIDTLARVFPLAPHLQDWSKEDSDLDGLRGDPAFKALYN